jgi:hypothetical protein
LILLVFDPHNVARELNHRGLTTPW